MIRLIDAEALKKAIEQIYDDTWDGIVKFGIEKAYNAIDNAPTVEPTFKPIAQFTIDEDKLKQIVNENVIEPIKRGELIIKDERPHGKWIGVEYYADGHPVFKVWECSCCREEHYGDDTILTNFCPNCGADMRSDNDKRST